MYPSNTNLDSIPGTLDYVPSPPIHVCETAQCAQVATAAPRLLPIWAIFLLECCGNDCYSVTQSTTGW